jgi:hypothetical protein
MTEPGPEAVADLRGHRLLCGEPSLGGVSLRHQNQYSRMTPDNALSSAA